MRLALWAAFLALGIAIAVAVTPAATAAFAIAGTLAAIPLAWRRAWALLLAVTCMSCGLGLGWRACRRAARPPPVEENRSVEVSGQVVQGADIEQPSQGGQGADDVPSGELVSSKRCRLRIALDTVDGRRADGTLSLVVLRGRVTALAGDWVHFMTRLLRPQGFANPGVPDALLLAQGQGIDYVAAVRDASDMHLERGPGLRDTEPLLWARRWAGRLRTAMASAIRARLPEPAAGFVRTMVIGERSDVSEATEEGFRAAGATHVLSVSGLHLAVVVALFFHAATWLFAHRPSWSLRFPAKVMAAWLSLPACFFYTLLTGEAVATVRSAIMAAMVLGATIVNRPASLAASIAGAAIVLLVASPLSLLDVSFQLSFASVIGLGLFSSRLVPADRTGGRTRWRRARGWLLRSFSASFAASLLTTPLVAHHFGEITPAAPIGNLVLVPIVELAVLPCGLVGSLLALVHAWLGALPLLLAGLASRLALLLAEGFRRFAPVALVRYPSWAETLLFIAAAACGLQGWAGMLADMRQDEKRWQGWKGGKGLTRWKAWKGWLVAGTVAATLACASLLRGTIERLRSGQLRVTFLDVGQGDATLVEGPGGFVALVDGGGRYDDSFDVGARAVEPALRARGITRLDLVVLSHPHPDHMNGLFRILKRFPTAAFWSNGQKGKDDGKDGNKDDGKDGNKDDGKDDRDPGYRDLLRLVRERGVSMPRPDRVDCKGMAIEALSPWRDGAIALPPRLEANDASLVVRVTYAGRQILFTGDIGDAGETELLEHRRTGTPLRSDVLKMPHHGSRHASSDRLIDSVRPTLAVASAGRFNRFGLPSPAALRRYISRGVEVLRTDRDGAVSVAVNSSGDISVVCVHDCPAPVGEPPKHGTVAAFLAGSAGSTLGVELELLADDPFTEAGSEAVLEAVGEGDLHLLDAAILHYLVQEGTRLGGVLIAKKLLDHIDRELAREVEHRVVEEKGDELFHGNLRRQN